MTQLENTIYQLLKPTVEAMGYNLWGLENLPQGKYSVLRIYIDHDTGVDLQACEAVSRQVSAVLDVEDPISGQYNLEVSSPGVDRRLFFPEQYHAYQGAEVQCWFVLPVEGKNKAKGTLAEVEENQFVLVVGEENVVVPFDAIKKVQVMPTF